MFDEFGLDLVVGLESHFGELLLLVFLFELAELLHLLFDAVACLDHLGLVLDF